VKGPTAWQKIALMMFGIPLGLGAVGGLSAWNSDYNIDNSDTYCFLTGESAPCSIEIIRTAETISALIVWTLIGFLAALVCSILIAIWSDLKNKQGKTGRPGR